MSIVSPFDHGCEDCADLFVFFRAAFLAMDLQQEMFLNSQRRKNNKVPKCFAFLFKAAFSPTSKLWL
jgi:hypothetical protein